MSLTKDILGRDEELFFNDLNITSKSLDNNSETKLIADLLSIILYIMVIFIA